MFFIKCNSNSYRNFCYHLCAISISCVLFLAGPMSPCLISNHQLYFILQLTTCPILCFFCFFVFYKQIILKLNSEATVPLLHFTASKILYYPAEPQCFSPTQPAPAMISLTGQQQQTPSSQQPPPQSQNQPKTDHNQVVCDRKRVQPKKTPFGSIHSLFLLSKELSIIN